MNFVIFNPDELRAESVGCYGHPLVQTPNMDRLAAEGVRFDQAHVQHTVCTPSRCSFMTGWYPHVRGHRTLWHCLRPEEPNLLKYLKQGGYEVAMFGKNDLLSPGSWDAGVDHLGSGKERSPHPSRVSEKDQPGYQNFLFEPKEGILDDLHDTDSVRLGIDFLSNRDTSKPFCLFLPLSYPHCPYTTVQPYYDMYDPDRLPPLRPAGKGEPDFHRLIREYRRLDEMEPQYLRKVNAVYLGMITALDAMLGRLLDALDEMNLADETAIIFLSDHGDWAGDRGLVEKWPSGLDDCLTRVPLILRVPGGAKGHVVRRQVEAFDIVPTILELAGIQPQHVHFARPLTEQVGGEQGDPDRAVFAEGGYDSFEPRCFEGSPLRDQFATDTDNIYYPKGLQQKEHPESVCRSTMIRTLKHKLIRRSSGRHELYDLQADPQEVSNVYGQNDYQPVKGELEQQMLDWFQRTSDVTPYEEHPRGHSWDRKGA